MSMPTITWKWPPFVAGLSVPRPSRPTTGTWLLAVPLALAVGCVAGGADALRDISASRSSMASAVLEIDRHVGVVALADTLASLDDGTPGIWGSHVAPGGGAVVTKGEVVEPLGDRAPRAGQIPPPRTFALQGERAVPYLPLPSGEWSCRHLVATLATGPLAAHLQVGRLGGPGSPGEWTDATDRQSVSATCLPRDGHDRTLVRVRP